MRAARRPGVLALVCAAAALGACGGGGNDATTDGASERRPVVGRGGSDERAAADLGFPVFATKNTTRVGGADAVANAAGVALAAFPSASRATRPAAVTLVDAADWRVAISAAQLAAEPVDAPLLYASGNALPPATAEALRRLRPTGSRAARGAQVIRIGTPAKVDGVSDTNLEGRGVAALARAIDAFQIQAADEPSAAVVIAPLDAPAYAMPAAAWAAKSGDPVLWASRDALPADTRAAIAAHGRPRIYVLGPESAIGAKVLDRLERLGSRVRRIGGRNAAAASVAFARFSDGGFGWNVVDPGHGLTFASSGRPADAGASAALATSGKYGPLLVSPDARALAPALRDYLLDIQPGYDKDPVRGVYNHAWLIGDEAAISLAVQAQIDALLEIQPVDRDA